MFCSFSKGSRQAVDFLPGISLRYTHKNFLGHLRVEFLQGQTANEALIDETGKDGAGVALEGQHKFIEGGRGKPERPTVRGASWHIPPCSGSFPPAPQALLSEGCQVNQRSKGTERLVGADVRSGLFPADMLLPGGHGQDKAAAAVSIEGLAHEPAGMARR